MMHGAQRLYAPKNEDVCENIEHKKNEYREEIYAGEEELKWQPSVRRFVRDS
jgi:hypothetical protein